MLPQTESEHTLVADSAAPEPLLPAAMPPPQAAWQGVLTWLLDAGHEGWAQIEADLRLIVAAAQESWQRLPIEQMTAEARQEAGFVREVAGEAWGEVRADLEDLVGAARRGLVRLSLEPGVVELRRWCAAARDSARLALIPWLRLAADRASAGREKFTGVLSNWLAHTPLKPLARRLGSRLIELWQRSHHSRRWMAERAGALAHWAAARSPWQESWLARWRTWIRRPQLLRYLIITDSALAASIVVILTVSAPVMQAAAPLPPLQARAILARGEARWRPAAALPLASATPLPTRTPSPTPEPLLTATPIPAAFSQWESWLPLHGGWNGAAECWGAVLAPMGTGHFTWPTDKHYLVGKDYNWRWHPGLDLGGEVGDPIYAADAGVVVYAGWNAYGFGNLVILDHGNGQHSLYGHLSEIHVTCGQGVPQGAILGLAGSTGYSTGPHLHFEIRSGGSNVNPWDYLP